MRQAAGPPGRGQIGQRRIRPEHVEPSALIDPLLDQRDQVGREGWLPDRHPLPLDATHALDLAHQQTVGGPAADERRPALTSTYEPRERVHREPGLGVVVVVAARAVLEQHRGDLEGKRHVARLQGHRCRRCRRRHAGVCRRGHASSLAQRRQGIRAIEHRTGVDPPHEQRQVLRRHLATTARHVAGRDHLDEPARITDTPLHDARLHEPVVRRHLESALAARHMAAAAVGHQERGHLPSEADPGRRTDGGLAGERGRARGVGPRCLDHRNLDARNIHSLEVEVVFELHAAFDERPHARRHAFERGQGGDIGTGRGEERLGLGRPPLVEQLPRLVERATHVRWRSRLRTAAAQAGRSEREAENRRTECWQGTCHGRGGPS